MTVLIVGLGSIAMKHIAVIRNLWPDGIIYALRSPGKKEDIERIINLTDLKEINTLNINFAIISNPTASHKQTILDLIQFGFPLFIEKPLFNSIDTNDVQILREISQRNIITYVACNLRFLGCMNFLREFIKGKRINEVNSYCGSYLPEWRPGTDFRKNYSADKEMGGGVHIDLIHEVDYTYWLFGHPSKVTATKTSKSTLEISSIDYANFLFEYPQFCVSIILNYYRRDAKRNLEVVLDEGTVVVDLLRNTVMYNGAIIYSSSNTIINTYEDQMKFFINEVVGEKKKFNSIDEAFEILKLCTMND
ncbi:Gfo/Idh/MocA family oxidoreductase [Flavihumibacter sp. R14]|nr:Gfo/Idh/MocA family oxidoreductase [Flavihumibacter soli]